MVRRGHDLHALAFFTLYIYTIFAQIGYVYFPELSILYNAYYGPNMFYKYWAFMFFSFVLSFFIYNKFNSKNHNKIVYIVRSASLNYGQYIFFLIVFLLYFGLTTYFGKYRAYFGYGGGTPMGGPWFGIGFWIFTICNFILYTLFRDKSNKIKKRRFSLIIFLLCTFFFLKVAIASGVRSTILYFFLCLIFYEVTPLIKTIKFQKRKIFIYLTSCFILINLLTILRTLRSQGEEISFSSFYNYESNDSKYSLSNQGLAPLLLLQDYYLPSHTLFVSMNYKIIDPLEVLKSNAANSLIKLNYPFLTTKIVKRATGSNHDRGAGWAYHYFVEGYNAMGFLGVFYNALFWNIGMYFWIRLTKSNNRIHNKAMLSVLVLVIVIAMRSQTSAFIQFYWLILLPALVLLTLANNQKIAFLKVKRTHRVKK